MATIALAAGGTGGHFFPAEALARTLQTRGHTVTIYTDARGIRYAGQVGDSARLVVLPAAAIGPGPLGKLRTLRTILVATLQARRDLKQSQAKIMVAFGGYPSFAPALAAWTLRRPLVLHEQATRVSLANRKLLPLASRLATSFPTVEGTGNFPAAQIVETGNPVRAEIVAARTVAYQSPVPEQPLRLLVVGGSQSASVFGEVVPPALLALPAELRARLRVSLQYASADAPALLVRLAAAGIATDIQPFFTDMATRLADCQLVICRGGASTAADLLTVGRPAIVVPIPAGGSVAEQRRNAETLQALGVGWCVPQPELTPERLTALLADLLGTPAKLTVAAAAARALGRTDAAERLADVVEAGVSR